MSALTILLFFVYTFGIGYSVTYFVKKPEKLSERLVMQTGMGLATIPILLVIFNLLHIPLDWRIVLVVSLALPVFGLYKKRSEICLPSLRLTKSTIYFAIVLLMFLLTFYMYHKGSFIYPWLEDGDPWEYAVAVKYVALHKTYDPPKELEGLYKEELVKNKYRYISNYLPPYPPGYVTLMAILHQTNTSVSWTLKYFTSLIAALGILFFYFFAKEFTKDNNLALFSTFILFAIPSYVSHFIYSQGLAATLFIIALYSLERTRHDSRWWFVAAVGISGVLITQSSSAAVFAVLFMPPYFLVRFLKKEAWKPVLLAGILGLVLSFIFWGSMIEKYTWAGTNPLRSERFMLDARRGNLLDIYTLSDFVWAVPADMSNMIDNPKGIGPAIFFLGLVGIGYFAYSIRKARPWLVIAVIWMALNVLNVNGERLPIGFNPHRGWSFLAFAVALIAAYGASELADTLKRFKLDKVVFFLAVTIAVLLTSGQHKYNVNTAMWPTHYFSSMTDIQGYMWLESLPDNTPVTSLCRHDEKVIGMDMYSTKQWEPGQRHFADVALNNTIAEIHDYLGSKGYHYMILDSSCIEKFGINKTNQRLQEFVGSPKFGLVYPYSQEQQETTFIFKLL